MQRLSVHPPPSGAPPDPFALEGQRGASSAEAAQLIVGKVLRAWYMLRRRWWVVVLAAAASVVAAASWVVRQPRVYRATSQVVLDLRQPVIIDKVTQVSDIRDAALDTDQFVQTQVREIGGRDLAEMVSKRLHMPKGSLLGRVGVERDPRALILYLSVADSDPARAAAIANGFAHEYERLSAAKRRGINENALKFLEDEAAKLRARLESSESARSLFYKKNELPGANFEDSHRILSSNLTAQNGRLSELRARKTRLEAQIEEFRDAVKSSRIPATIPVEEAAERWAELYKAATEAKNNAEVLKQRYGDRHPKLRDARLAAAAAESELRIQMTQLKSDIESRMRAIEKEERMLAALVRTETNRALSLRQFEGEYNRLERDVTGDREAYDLIARRLRETQLTSMLADGFAKVLEEAPETSVPISPRVAITLWTALMIGLVLGVGLTVLLEFVDDSVRSPQDVEEVVGLPLLGTLPSILTAQFKRGAHAPVEVELARAEFISKNPRSVATEHCHAFSTNLYSVFLKHPPKSIAVVGASPSEGKSFVAIGLASTVASRGRRVLIVDCDLRRGRLHSTFGVPRADGVYEILTSDVPVDKAIRQSGLPNVDVLPTGMVPEMISPIRLLELPDFALLVEELERRYDFVVFDTPPLSLVSDAQIIGPLCDGALAVTRFGHSTRRSLRNLVMTLRKARTEVVGVVVNDVDTSSGQYQYYYRGYGYAYTYGGGYGPGNEDHTT